MLHGLRSALTLAAAAISAAAALAGTHTLTITAVVLSKNVCSFRTTGALTITVNPASATPATGSASWVLRCNGSSPVATYAMSGGNGQWFSGGTRRVRHDTTTTEFMAYTLDVPVGGSVNRNTDTPFTITASIAPSDFQNALPGSYSDTVLITLTP